MAIERKNLEGSLQPSLLNKIYEQLPRRRGLYIAGEFPVTFRKGLAETLGDVKVAEIIRGVQILIAPTNPNYDVNSLNRFGEELIADLPGMEFLPAEAGFDKGISFGRFAATEVIGRRYEEVDTLILPTDGLEFTKTELNKGRMLVTQFYPLKQDIQILIYPSAIYANSIARYLKWRYKSRIGMNHQLDYLRYAISGPQLGELKSAERVHYQRSSRDRKIIFPLSDFQAKT